MRIRNAKRITGQIAVPGDKSISHRVAMIAAIANGTTVIENYATSADCASTLSCLSQLGVEIRREVNTVTITGLGGFGRVPREPLDCGNSGTTMRLMAGLLAGQDFTSELTGDDSLRSRPMRRVIEPLEMMGAHVLSENGHAPLRIMGARPLTSITYESPVASAQVKSCVLLAGLNARRRTSVVERHGVTRDHTERMLRWFGVPVVIGDGSDAAGVFHQVSVDGQVSPNARDYRVAGDLSSAAFFIAAAAVLPGSELMISDVGLNPTRTQFIKTMRRLGAQIRIDDQREVCNEPVGTIVVKGGLTPTVAYTSGCDAPRPGGRGKIEWPLIPELIDELPMLAVVGTQIEGGLVVRDAGELRFKESDRIATLVENLRAMGATVAEYEDGFAVVGPAQLRGARIDSHGDHRIAMAFSVAALIAEGETEIVGAECAAVSFPEFYDVLEAVSVS